MNPESEQDIPLISENSAGPRKYERPHDNDQALQTAIKRWIEFEYGIWVQTQQDSIKILDWGGTLLRIVLIALAGTITIASGIKGVDPIVITILGGLMTVLTGVEGYLKLADRKVSAEN